MSGLLKPGVEAPADSADDYTASIELSNACREFYRNRVKATESFKQTMSSPRSSASTTKRTGIDDAMDKLKSEMASLMDQDLSLMKQLLTLNEAIEDLKTKRLYHVSKDSLRASSQELHASDWSVSETDMFDSEEDLDKKSSRVHDRHSSSSLPVPMSTHSLNDSNFKMAKKYRRNSDITIMVNGNPVQVHHGQQSSIDSGYGDDATFSSVYNGPLEVTF